MEKEVTHKETLALISAGELTQLRSLSDWPGTLHLAGHLMILAATGFAVLHTTGIFWLAASIAHGVVLVFLFTPLHESVHGTAFRSTWLNAAVSHLAGYLLLLPARYFRYFHFAHHRFTQNPEFDPELETPKPRTWPQYLWYLSGIPFWKGAGLVLINHARGKKIGAYVPAPAIAKLIREARLYLVAYALTFVVGLSLELSWILYLWILPALLGQPFLRAYLLAEHAACPLVADMLANTRTTFCNASVRFLAWNMPHHTAHHALPTVPFHQLPHLTRLLDGRLKATAQGYGEAHRQIRKAWKA